MGLPGVDIIITGGALGGVSASADGIAGLIITGIAIAGKIELNEPTQVFSLKEVEDLGINSDYDTANGFDTYQQIKNFYAQAGTGSELWIMLVADTVTISDMFDINEADNAIKLLNAAKGSIRLLAAARIPDVDYLATYLNGFDDDAFLAITKAQELATFCELNKRPIVSVIGARAFSGTAGDLTDLRTLSCNNVGVVLLSTEMSSNNADVGLALGRLAATSVQRNIGRVKTGNLGLDKAYLSDGETIESHETALDSIHDKGYIIGRTFVGKAGYYFNDDPTATSLTDDRQGLARNRVINKAIIIAYSYFVNEVNDDVSISPDGSLLTGYVKGLQEGIENSINGQMTANNEISYVSCFIDDTQNVVSTNKLKVKLRIGPTAYTKDIEIELGFENPFTT